MCPGHPDPASSSGRRATSASLAAMNWLNFLTALMQTAFGAFLSVYLTTHGWSATDIGAVLGVGTVVVIVCQVPGGALLDWLHRTRLTASFAVAAIMVSAALMAIAPHRLPVFAAACLQGAGASLLSPAIAALTLAISRHEKLGEKFGHNVRYAAVGSAVAAMAIGVVARFSDAAGFWLAVACGIPALAALWAIRVSDIEAAPIRTTHVAVLPRHARPQPLKSLHALLLDHGFLVFAGCMMLFQLGNAALLPTAARAVAEAGAQANLAIGVAIMIPQLLAAAVSPWVGQLANHPGVGDCCSSASPPCRYGPCCSPLTAAPCRWPLANLGRDQCRGFRRDRAPRGFRHDPPARAFQPRHGRDGAAGGARRHGQHGWRGRDLGRPRQPNGVSRAGGCRNRSLGGRLVLHAGNPFQHQPAIGRPDVSLTAALRTPASCPPPLSELLSRPSLS